ncbi:MAG: DUF86 domain-containing protein [Oscillospiraceae bacterium]|nr:DUF86 domain-containing protein [Oscillospiraceae bacterium]
MEKILSYAVELQKYIEETHLDRDTIFSDKIVQWTITTPLYNIGEQVYNLTDEFKKMHPEVSWNLISGMRHRLVHDYDGTNWYIISDTIFKHLPLLIDQLKIITASNENTSVVEES